MLKSVMPALLLSAAIAVTASAKTAPPPPPEPLPPGLVVSQPVETRLDMHIGGRVLPLVRGTDRAWAYQWPAIYFEGRFKGPSVALAFDDPNNSFNVLVDDRVVAQLNKPGRTRFTLDNLGDGPHVIRLEKRTETQYGTGIFKGFFVPDKSLALAPPKTKRAIEFIGDSVIAGSGNTAPAANCTADQVLAATDSQQSPGAVTAKHYKADYQINAFSGLGMVRNFDGRAHPKYDLPMLYPRVLFDDKRADDTDWSPQIIVVDLGAADFATPVHADEPWKSESQLRNDFEAAYLAFVSDLRQRHPQATIVLAAPAGRGGYTDGTLGAYYKLKAQGDTRVVHLTLPATTATGCNGFPNIQADAQLADAYVALIDGLPDAWQETPPPAKPAPVKPKAKAAAAKVTAAKVTAQKKKP
ncbi:MAG TPA: lipolytic enzyme, G-D-S-L [Asticcacaulis sp.]|nr:lipolytic enzyme, G-D-S-L [Asticcacaulis sp.]